HATDVAKEVLDYAYEKTMRRTRLYMTPRTDENIRHEVKRNNMRETEVVNTMNDGLSVTIPWYKATHILRDAYSTVRLKPSNDTFVQKGLNTAPGKNESLLIGAGRIGFLKFDISEQRNSLITSADLGVYKYWSGNSDVDVYYATEEALKVNGNSWNENNLLYTDVEKMTDGNKITSFDGSINEVVGFKKIWSYFIAGGNNRVTPWRLSTGVLDTLTEKIVSTNDNDMSFVFTMDETKTDKKSAADYFTKEANNEFAPFLEIKTNIVPIEKLYEKRDFMLNRYDLLMKKTEKNVGAEAGNYRTEDYRGLINAKELLDQTISVGDQTEVGIAMVGLYDAMRNMSDRQLIRTNIDPNSNLFFTAEEKLDIVKKIETNSQLKDFYDLNTASANIKSVEQYKEGYELYRNPRLWNNSGEWADAMTEFNGATYDDLSGGRRQANPKPPQGATYVSYEIVLPKNNNTVTVNERKVADKQFAGRDLTENWLDHVWIDMASLTDENKENILTSYKRDENGNIMKETTSTGEEKLVIDDMATNLNFEKWNGNMPANWEFVGSGSPTFKKEDLPNYKKEGSYSLKMMNNNVSDEAAIRYTDPNYNAKSGIPANYMFPIKVDNNGVPVPLDKEKSISLNLSVKQDGVLDGFNQLRPIDCLRVIVKFYDKDGKLTTNGKKIAGAYGNFTQTENTYNAPFNYRANGNQRPNVGDALAYMVTGDKTYAEKIKYSLLTVLNDFACSSEINEATNDEANARGEVQLGRQLSVMLGMYAMIEDANVFTPEEFETFKKLVDVMIEYCTSKRDHTIYPDEQYVNSNWYVDMFLGASLASMALREPDPNNPGMMRPATYNGKQLMDNAEWFMRNTLEHSIAESGAYSESLRYFWASYSRVMTAAKAYANNLNDNWFKTTKLPLLFDYGVQTQTTPYEYIDGKISSPTFGDTTIKEGTVGMAMLGQYFQTVAEVNPALGMQMMETWKRAGSPVGRDAEGVDYSVFFLPLESENPTNIPLELTSTDYYHQASPIMMRNNYKRDNETLVVPVSSTIDLNHGHEDQGSFTMFKYGSFLVVDTSVENYWDSGSKYVYLSSSNHSCLTFYNDGIEPIRENEQMSNHMSTANVTLDAVGGGVSKLRESSYNDMVDKVKIEIKPLSGGGNHFRNLALVKGMDAVVIWDQIVDNSAYSQFNLPTASVKTTIDPVARKTN
ncbi:MAG: hypothetical protein RSC29_00485, partial [Oscillospiraceae bacterium]